MCPIKKQWQAMYMVSVYVKHIPTTTRLLKLKAYRYSVYFFQCFLVNGKILACRGLYLTFDKKGKSVDVCAAQYSPKCVIYVRLHT